MPDLTGFRRSLDAYLSRVEATTDLKINLDIATAAASAKIAAVARDRSVNLKVDVDRSALQRVQTAFAASARGLSSVASLLSPLRLAIAGALPLIGPVATGVVQLSGALALVPAVAGAAGVGLGAVVLGLHGFGAALKDSGDPAKFAKALQGLAPAAAATAIALRGLSPALEAVRRATQQNLFAGLAVPLTALARAGLPLVQRGLAGVAQQANVAVKSLIAFLRLPTTLRDTSTGLSNTTRGFRALNGAVTPLLQVFRDLSVVGSAFLPGMAQGFTNVTTRLAAFVAQARQTGQLSSFISGGLQAFRDLGASVLNVGKALANVFQIASANGGGFLAELRTVTGALAKLSASADVQRGLGALFAGLSRGLGTAVSALSAVLGRVIAAAGPAFGALATAVGQVAAAVVTGLAPVLVALGPVITQVATQLGPVLAQAIRSLAPLFLAVVAAVLPLIPPLVSLVSVILPPLAAVLGHLGPLLQAVVLGFIAFKTAVAIGAVVQAAALAIQILSVNFAVLSAILLANPIGLVIIGLVALGAALVIAYQNSATFRSIVDSALHGAATAARVLGSVVSTVFGGIRSIVGTVTGFVVNVVTGGFGSIVGIVTSTTATVRAVVSTGWAVARAAVAAAVAGIHAVINTLGSIVGFVAGVFGRARAGAIVQLANLLSFVGSLPSRVIGALSGIGTAMFRAGVNIVSSLKAGLQAAAAGIGSFFSKLIPGPIAKLLPHSPVVAGPLTVLNNGRAGKAIVQALVDGMKARQAAMVALGAQLGQRFLLGVTASAASARTTLAALTSGIGRNQAVPSSSRNSAFQVLRAEAVPLQRLIAARESLVTRLKAAQTALVDAIQQRADLSKSTVDNVLQFANITALSTGAGPDGLVSLLQDRVDAIRQYQANLAALAAKGFGTSIIAQIASAGVDVGGKTASVLASATAEQVKQIVALQGRISTLATATGTTVFNALTDAGVKAAQGLVAGLQSQQGAIEAQLLRIARAMQTAIKRALGIHSPSSVFMKIGEQVSSGLALGIERTSHRAATAASRMVSTGSSAVPRQWQDGAVPGGQIVNNFNGTFGWMPDEVARRIDIKRRDALALAAGGML